MAKLATATRFSKCTRSHKRRHINQLDGLRSLMKVFQFKANDFKMLVSDNCLKVVGSSETWYSGSRS